MNDPIYPPQAYIMAHDIVRHVAQNLAIQAQLEMDSWDRDTMQKHVNTRSALIKVQGLLMDACEKALKATKD